eukprot:1574686-Alexandrium_andersonii.AAC.1
MLGAPVIRHVAAFRRRGSHVQAIGPSAQCRRRFCGEPVSHASDRGRGIGAGPGTRNLDATLPGGPTLAP